MRSGIAIHAAVLLVACLPVLQPQPGAYGPCGVHGVECSAESGGGCCDAGEEFCGHDHRADQDPTDTCPAGQCCAKAPDQDEAPPPLMMHRQAPKR